MVCDTLGEPMLALEGAGMNAPTAVSASLFKGGPTLVDLLIDAPELRITVTGPGMLFDRLVLVTTLSALDGATVERLRGVADSLEGSIHCGLTGIERAPITVVRHRSGGRIEIGLGPATMYQSELVLRTRTGESFAALLRRLLADDPTAPLLAALHPLTATGHLERHHHPGPGEHGHHHAEGGRDGRP